LKYKISLFSFCLNHFLFTHLSVKSFNYHFNYAFGRIGREFRSRPATGRDRTFFLGRDPWPVATVFFFWIATENRSRPKLNDRVENFWVATEIRSRPTGRWSPTLVFYSVVNRPADRTGRKFVQKIVVP
jgi:hypothetical protein